MSDGESALNRSAPRSSSLLLDPCCSIPCVCWIDGGLKNDVRMKHKKKKKKKELLLFLETFFSLQSKKNSCCCSSCLFIWHTRNDQESDGYCVPVIAEKMVGGSLCVPKRNEASRVHYVTPAALSLSLCTHQLHHWAPLFADSAFLCPYTIKFFFFFLSDRIDPVPVKDTSSYTMYGGNRFILFRAWEKKKKRFNIVRT